MRQLSGRPESAAEAATRQWPVNRPRSASADDAEPRVHPRTRRRSPTGFLALTMLVLFARALPAQAIGQGFELERAGQYEQAAGIYLATLRADPTNLSALLGLERVLPPLNRLEELLPVARRAAAAGPQRRSEEHTSELQSQSNLVCRLLLEKKKKPDYN